MKKFFGMIFGVFSKKKKKKKPALNVSGRHINEIVVHCSASDYAHHDNIESLRSWHLERGWSDIGYHSVLTKDGKKHNGRDESIMGAGVKGNNRNTIHICLTGNNHFSAAQFKALRTELKRLCKKYSIKYEYNNGISPHNRYANKACPNFNLKKMLTNTGTYTSI
jgi:hypothetical protein